MVCVAGEVQGVLEIWDLSRGGDEPLKRTLEVPQSVRVGEVVIRVSCLCKRKIGSFGLILQWDRNKVNLMDVARERTIGDVGVDFASGTTYTLLITEWPSSPSEGDDEQKMSCVDGGGPSILLDVLDLSRGVRSDLQICPATRVIELFQYVVVVCKHKAGTFGLILRYGRSKIELSDKDTRRLTEVGVDLSSPSTVMLLVTETAESPNAETGAKASTPTDDCPPATTSPSHQVWEWPNKKPEGDGGTEKDPSESDERGTNTFDPIFWASECAVGKAPELKDQAENDELGTVRLYKKMVKIDYEGEIPETETEDARSKRIFGQKSFSRRNYQSRRAEQPRHDDNDPNQRSDTGYVGLVNQAMTCYLNSLLQALYMTPEFRNALYNWEYDSGSEKDEAKSIPYQLQKLFLNLQTSTKNAIETTSLTKSFGWDSTEAWQQHDIQELCRVMFDALEQTFKKTEQADLINRLYEGKMIDYVKCLECGTEKSREDTFLDIPLPVKPFGSNVAYNSVEEALAAFVQPETLDGTNQYHCETCNKKCDAHKGLKFTKFPYLLTLHLKRFDFDYNTFHRIKLNDEVTFPDILNLNSFIASTASQDSPCADEDGGVGVKCDDSSTTDSGTLDDECPPCDNGMPVSDNSMNQDHDDDEGIDMSNGPSTSNCTTHNHDNEKNRGNRQEAKGPYEYELFSIMIHSGSASGGHYYAYIKDFRTGEWLCFNDQNVSPITEDDIQKTYGGGPARTYYSGVYSSSTNAYMLMYRQIDPVRNTLPMQVAAFPKHLQELLVKMQEFEYNEMKNREMVMQMYRLRVFCHRPNEKALVTAKLFCLYDETWAELTERAYNSLSLENVVDRDRVRLVTYQESTGLIECSFDGREHETLRAILEDQQDLLLEIRKKDEKFQTYLPGGLPTKVYVVDVAKKEVVKGPINVRGLVTQTVLEYKEQLGEILGMKPKDIQLILQYPNNPTIRLVSVAKNDAQLQAEGFSCANKIFVPTISDTDTTKSIQDSISEIREVFGDLISFTVELPDTSKEALRALSIPSLEEINKDKPSETPVTNSSTKAASVTDGSTDTTDKPEASATTLTTKAGGDEVPGFRNETTSPSATQPEGEEWHTPEQSNSEDSSLSYSDRTLVGEGDASEDDDYPLANIDNEFFNQTEQEKWDIDDTAERYFKAERDEDDEKLLRVVVDKKMILRTLKKLLEPYIGVPENWFKIYRQCICETECNQLTAPIASKFQEGDVLCVKLGRALRSGEYRAMLYQMTLDSEGENFTFLCECIVSKNATVGQTKKEILVELKKRFDLDIPFERCRLRRKNNKIASSVFLNDQKFKDVHHNWPSEIIVQELPGKEPVTDPNDVVLFVRRVMKPDAFLGPIEEVVVSGKSIAELREKLSEISGIPEEHLEMAKGKRAVSWDVMMFVFEKVLDWNRPSTQTDNHPPTGLEDGAFIYYRDWREKATEPASEDLQYGATTKAKSRLLGISSSPRYSPRRERALKIYVDDK